METRVGAEAEVVVAPPGRGGRVARGAVAVCCWLYLLLALGLWALLYQADVWWPATFLMFSPRAVLAFPLALLLPAAAALRRRSLWVVAAAAAVVAGPVMGLCVPWRLLVAPLPAGPHLRLMTCNMHYRAQDPAPLDRLVADVMPDVVLLQEWNAASHSEILEGADWHVVRVPGLFLASRFPVRQSERLGANSMGERGSVMRYVLDTPAGAVTLFSLHFATPRDDLRRVIHDRPEGPEDLRLNSERRRLQSEHVAGEAAQAAGPVLIAGDFNTPPESVLFRDVWAPYTDAFGAAGWGWGYTFINERTTVRIDHILAGAGWRCARCWVGPHIGPPHRPVLADLTWARAASD